MSTSATGGYLVPLRTNSELNDAVLADFLQSVVVGITGIAGSLVRPRWQADPPTLPDANASGITWAAIGVTGRAQEPFAYVAHTHTITGSPPALEPQDLVVRNEILSVLVSFYGPNAESRAQQFAMGLQVAQNREAMQIAGFGLLSAGDPQNAPELINQRWLFRTDVPFKVRRQQKYSFAVLDVASAEFVVEDGDQTLQVIVGN